ncbi:uncharacterized protein LACBIDRAFT_297796 [Laccaria bicolor S238N-H82]|uniref:Predicted protein n=1 Tax=Laccaria bicolor (strain S238N-H82 / ATCC MYA-4686) TaxID=486041 RepID=B0DAW9_LACBS|nr:uncharacterized protein LACBIDRAFT_297796 [Laccaria bicolor S238N-H82]EDR08104.1 predicted protein [Laccaria bicolor S238N-H82]|eukprot:XP_001881174.1 predicted protein [Laccaria bicolor S238N-H82]
MATESIVVNGFMFCATHGDEYCHICCCDYRMGNNVRIEEEMSEFFEFESEMEARHPINAYAHGAVAALMTEESYQCEKHQAVDCDTCFNWVAVIKKEAQAAEEEGRWMTKRRSLIDKE